MYTKIESGEIINVDTIQQKTEQEEQLNKIDDTSGDINPYKELISKQCRENRAMNDRDGAMVYSEQSFKLHTT